MLQERVCLLIERYGHICKRINRLNVNIKNNNIDDDDLIIAADSTGIKVTNRGPVDEQEMECTEQKRISQDPCSRKRKLYFFFKNTVII